MLNFPLAENHSCSVISELLVVSYRRIRDSPADSPPSVADAEHFEAHRTESGPEEAEVLGDAGRDIEGSLPDERPAVVHAEHGRAAVAKIGHAHFARERKRLVRGRARPGILAFADRRLSGKKDEPAFIIMGGDPLLDIADRLLRFQRCVMDPPHPVGLVFVALVALPATGEKEAEQEKAKGLSYRQSNGGHLRIGQGASPEWH